MQSFRWAVIICTAVAACAPKLNGTCTANSDCQSGESCSPDGLCLRDTAQTGESDAGDAGNTDAGKSDAGNTDAGNTDAGNADAGNLNGTAISTITSPSAAAFVPRVFPVAATVTTDSAAITSVSFLLNSADMTDAGLGALDVTPSGAAATGTFSVNDVTFNGAALLRAVAHRTGASDIVSAAVSVTVDQIGPALTTTWNSASWYPRSGNVTVTAATSDTAAGIGSAQLTIAGGNTYPATIASGTATFAVPAAELADAGTVAVRAFSLVATDAIGNATILAADAGNSISVDDVPPAITPVSDTAWHNGSINVLANVTDQGSGIATTSALFASGPNVAGVAGAGSAWSFPIDLAASYPAYEGTISYQIVSGDAAGNTADAGGVLQVDTLPPAVSALAIDTAADVVDLNGKGWFKGPTLAPAGGPIQVSALIADGNLVTSPPPTAIAGSTPAQGSSSNNRWHFPVPRSVGQGVSGAVDVTFDAQDLAGNHVVASPVQKINFDDVKTLTLSASNDSSFHGGSETVSVSVTAAPPSGFPLKGAAVDLAAAGKLSFGSCSAISADASSTIATWPAVSTLVFKVPMSCAPANSDGGVGYSVTVTSLAGGTGTTTGTINVDTRGPVTGDLLVFYPASPGGPLSWSHDGSHFTRLDSGALLSFAAYDCHGGLSASNGSVSGLPGASAPQSADGRGVLTNGCGAPVKRFTVSANLAQVPTSSLTGADNPLPWSVTVTDGFGNASTISGTINVTRRYWQTTPGGGLSFLALGPRLFVAASSVAMYSLDPATGAQGNWDTPSDMPHILPNAGTPAVVYVKGNTVYAGNAAAATTAIFGSCSHGTLDYAAPIGASAFAYHSHVINSVCDTTCLDCAPGPKCSCSACFNDTQVDYDDQLVLNGTGVTCTTGPSTPSSTCQGTSAGPTNITNRIFSATPAAYMGLSGNTWIMANSAGTWTDSVGGAASPTWALFDGSSPPIVYLTGTGGVPGRIDPWVVSNVPNLPSRPFALPDFPAAITDMLLSKNGILYVLSNNQVFAVITDSVGGATAAGGTQTSGWPSQCRDPCRSSNPGIQCPY